MRTLSIRGLLIGPVVMTLVTIGVVVGLRSVADDPAPEVYAHRGGTSGLVENSRENYRRAAAAGWLHWETDVRFTRDDTPVLLHDPDLGRYGCPRVKIARASLSRARECSAPDGQTPTPLADFVTDQSALGAQSMIELKTVPTPAQWAALEPQFDRVRPHLVVESFRPAALLAASEKGYETAFLTKKPVPPAELPPGTDWYAPEWPTLTGGQVRAMHAAGVRVVVWTPGCPDRAKLPSGLDAIIIDEAETDCRGAVRV